MTVPFTDPVTDLAGHRVRPRLARASARSIELVYPDGGHRRGPARRPRFYVAEVPERTCAPCTADGLLLIARDADGEALAQAVVPNDAITPPSEAERPKDPIEVDTVSTGGDLTQVLACAATSTSAASRASPSATPTA